MIVYILSGWIVCLTLILIWSLARQPLNKELIRQNRELLNRLQAGDLKTFVALQTSLNPLNNSEYVSQDDESEAKRLIDASGVGETQFLDDGDVRQYSLEDFSLREFR